MGNTDSQENDGSDYVVLPHLYVYEKEGTPPINIWDLVVPQMEKRINNEDVMIKMSPVETHPLLFSGLKSFFELVATEEEKKNFFGTILPAIQHLVLLTPEFVPSRIRFLLQGHHDQVTLSKRAISCLLACAFFGIIPPQIPNKLQHMPRCTMLVMYRADGIHDDWTQHQSTKFRAIVNYFDRVTKKVPLGYVTFYRRQLSHLGPPDWLQSTVQLTHLNVFEEGLIEDDHNAAQVDFANQFLGGGVLERGCVQEEMRFSMSTECIAGMMFCSQMLDDEAIIIKGAERYSNLNGYGSKMEYAGNYEDQAEWDNLGHKRVTIIAIDAISFMGNDPKTQFSQKAIIRELNKAYCGFVMLDEDIPIATGNWGCGAFLGNLQLKAIIQLLAASQVKRSLEYYSFKKFIVTQPFLEVYTFLKEKSITVGQIVQAVLDIGSTKELFRNLILRFGGEPKMYTETAPEVTDGANIEVVEGPKSEDRETETRTVQY